MTVELEDLVKVRAHMVSVAKRNLRAIRLELHFGRNSATINDWSLN